MSRTSQIENHSSRYIASVKTLCGKVVRVRGSVVDIRFDHGMPDLRNALGTGDKGEVIIEVATHLDETTVRGIALTPTEGLARGHRSPNRVGWRHDSAPRLAVAKARCCTSSELT